MIAGLDSKTDLCSKIGQYPILDSCTGHHALLIAFCQRFLNQFLNKTMDNFDLIREKNRTYTYEAFNFFCKRGQNLRGIQFDHVLSQHIIEAYSN